MRKSLFLIGGLLVITLNVFGMNNCCIVPEDVSQCTNSNKAIVEQGSFTSLTANFQEVTNRKIISEEELNEVLKLPKYPEKYKEIFFDAIETDFNIDRVTAKEILKRWDIEKRKAFELVEGLTKEEIIRWQKTGNYLILKQNPILHNLLGKLKESRKTIYKDFRSIASFGIKRLINYRDYMLIRFSEKYSYGYNIAMSCNNNQHFSTEALNWLASNDLETKRSLCNKNKVDIVFQIYEGKNFDEIKKVYPGILPRQYGAINRYVRCWFDNMSDLSRRLFAQKINGDKDDKNLGIININSFRLDLDALVFLIQKGKLNFIHKYKTYVYSTYQGIAFTWKILVKNELFKKPDWCSKDNQQEAKKESLLRKSSKLSEIRQKQNLMYRYLQPIYGGMHVTGVRKNKGKNIVSFYKHELERYEKSEGKYKDYANDSKGYQKISGGNFELKRNKVYRGIQRYFGLEDKDIQRVFEPFRSENKTGESGRYKGITSRNIELEVEQKISEYKKNGLLTFEAMKMDSEQNGVNSKAREIVKYLWDIGFSPLKIIELLDLKKDFETKIANLSEKRKANSEVASQNYNKRQRSEEGEVGLTMV